MKTHVLAILGAFGIAAAATAQTQNTGVDATPYGISVRGGIAFPIDKSYSDFAGSLIGLGVDYTFTRPLFRGGETFFSLDYQTKRFGDRGSVFPIALNQKFYTNRGDYGTRTYTFVGLGVTVADFNGSKTAISGRLGIGKELGEKLFTEATLFISDRAGDVRPNSVGLFVGYRF